MHRFALVLATLSWLVASPSFAQDGDHSALFATDAGEVRTLLAARRSLAGADAAIRACGQPPSLALLPGGSHALSFTIDVDRRGRVEWFGVEPAGSDSDLPWLACVEAAAREVRFEPAGAATTIVGQVDVEPARPAIDLAALGLMGPDVAGSGAPRSGGWACCVHEARAVRAVERRLRGARTDAARARLHVSLAATQQAASACVATRCRPLGSLASPDRGPKALRGRASLADGGQAGGEGDIEESAVGRALRGRLTAIQACYDRRLRSAHPASGAIEVEFALSLSGAVSEVQTQENTTGDVPLAECVRRAVRRLHVERAPQGGTASFAYTLRFGLIE